jgi:hypothetical protein
MSLNNNRWWQPIDVKLISGVILLSSILLLVIAIAFFTGYHGPVEEPYRGILHYSPAFDPPHIAVRSLIDAGILACLGYGLWRIRCYAWWLNSALLLWRGGYLIVSSELLGLGAIPWLIGCVWTIYRFPLYIALLTPFQS